MIKKLPRSIRGVSARFSANSSQFFLLLFVAFSPVLSYAQTLSFPGAMGFGRYAPGARGLPVAARESYVVTNLKDNGAGSFRDAVSKPGRVVTFAVGGIINIATDLAVSANTTIAGQTAPGTGILVLGRKVTFSGSNNTIARFMRYRYGGTAKEVDASGLASGANMMFDHMSFSWGTDEVFSINSDGNGTSIDNITLQNCIIAQGIHRHNHSASGLIQPPTGGKVSLIQNLYISNKTRNPKVKGINEFVNNVVYNWGNANRLGETMNYGWSGEAYIMGGDSGGESFANIINNYFVGGPSTSPSNSTPFSRGNSNFNLYGAGNYFDNDRDGVLDGAEVPYNITGYPTGDATALKGEPYDYPAKNPSLTAAQAYQYVIDNVGSSYPRRDQVDSMLLAEVASKGTQGFYVYVPSDLPFANGGAGYLYNARAPLDTDMDGMPDAYEDANSLNKNNKADAVQQSTMFPEYMNIEVYVNALLLTPAATFVTPPVNVTLNAVTSDITKLSSVTVKWEANSESRNFFILERSLNGTTFTEIARPVATTRSYLDNNVSANTTYFYRIKSVTATDESVFSEAASVKVPQLPGVYDYKAGDYRSLKSGNWGSSTVSTDIWETYNGTAWLPATTPPAVAVPPAAPIVNTVVIASGHEVKLNETTTVNNLIVESGATLKAGTATGASGTAAVKNLRITDSLVNNGTVGSSGTATDRITIEGYRDSGTITIAGSEMYYLNNFVVNSIAKTVDVLIDANLNINGYLRAPYAITGAADNQNDDSINIIINTGKTVTLTTNSTAAYLHNNNATTITTTNFGDYIYTINGTLDMKGTGTSCIIGHSTLDREVTVNTNGTWLTGNAMRIVSTATPTSVGSSYFNIGTGGLVDGAARVTGSATSTNFVFSPGAGINKYPFFNITGNGKLKRVVTANATATFPIGADEVYSPVIITNGSTAGGFSVNASPIDSYGRLTVQKRWTITPDFVATGVKLGFSWLADDEIAGFNPANPSIYYYNNGIWQINPATITPGRQGTIDLPNLATLTTAVDDFGVFTVGNESPVGNPLPLNLLSFKAALNGGISKTVMLSWSTANEVQTDRFTVERKTSNDFIAIGSVVANNTTGINTYSLVDYKPAPGSSYYRLKLQDKDGKTTYSSIQAVKISGNMLVSAYPNPAATVLNINYPTANGGATLSIYNVDGKKLMSKPIANGSIFTPGIDISRLAPGFYVVSFRDFIQHAEITFVKQ